MQVLPKGIGKTKSTS